MTSGTAQMRLRQPIRRPTPPDSQTMSPNNQICYQETRYSFCCLGKSMNSALCDITNSTHTSRNQLSRLCAVRVKHSLQSGVEIKDVEMGP